MRIAIDSFRGEAPRVTPRALPDNGSQSAVNARLQSGDLESWRQLQFIKLLANSNAVETIYLLNDKWLSWEAQVDVARGAIPGDDTYRTYLTAPTLYDQPRFTNYTWATTGSEPFPVLTRPLGVPNPDSQPTLVAGVSTLSNPAVIDITDSGDEFATAWSSNSAVSTTFTRAIASQDASVGNGAPSYSLQVQENTEVPCWMIRDFGIGNSQVLEYSFDFEFNAATQKRMWAGVLVSATGAGLGVHWNETGAFQIGLLPSVDIRGFSPLAGATTFVPGNGVFYTCSVQVVTNAQNTRTVTATLYQGSAQIAAITCTNSFSNRGGYLSFMNQIADAGAPDKFTWYDNLLIRATPPSTTIEQVATSYVFTFVNDLGEESGPSLPSATILKDDGTAITVTTATSVQSGYSVDYGVTTKRIYRAASGATGTAFLFVAEIPLSQADYVDELTDSELGDPIESTDWNLPPDDLEGILALPNGVMVGFRRNQLCFSAQNQPHAWPVKFRLNTDTAIVGIGNIDNTVVVGTEAFPYLAVGNDPAAYSMSKLEKQQACVSKRSVVHLTGIGVVFASPDGLVAVSSQGRVENITETIYTRRQWQDLVPTDIRAAAHDEIYFFMDGNSEGHALDMKQTGFGLIQLGFHALAMYSDPLTDHLYLVPDDINEPVASYLPASSTAPTLPEVFNEKFDDGLTPYTLTTGVLTPYSIISDDYGPALFCAARTSGVADTIDRSITAKIVSQFSLKFKVSARNIDDACIFGLMADGSFKFGMNPSRESAFDALQRPSVTLDSEEHAIGTVAVTLNRWYRCDVVIATGANNSSATIVDLTDDSVFGTVTFTSSHTPTSVNGIRFFRDSGNTTSATYFDEIIFGNGTLGTSIYQFDGATDLYGDMVYSWKSKLNLLPYPAAFQFCQVRAADYANLVMNFYYDEALFHTHTVTSKEPFRIPLLDEYEALEVEFVGTSRVRTMQLAEDIREIT